MPQMQGIGHVTLTVTDVHRSAEFYNRLFDSQTVLDDADDYGPVRLIAGPSIMLGFRNHPTTGASDSFEPTRVGLDHLGIAVDSREELEKWRTRASEIGAAFSEIVESPHGLHLNVKDPDNIPIEFLVLSQG